MSFWSDIDPTNPHSRYFHPIQAKRWGVNKSNDAALKALGGDPAIGLLGGLRAGDGGYDAAVSDAKDALARRNPYTDGNQPDYTDALMKQVQNREFTRLGIGTTRQSLFTLSPAAAIISGGYSR
jgi:hypothetical protein